MLSTLCQFRITITCNVVGILAVQSLRIIYPVETYKRKFAHFGKAVLEY